MYADYLTRTRESILKVNIAVSALRTKKYLCSITRRERKLFKKAFVFFFLFILQLKGSKHFVAKLYIFVCVCVQHTHTIVVPNTF